MRDQTWGEHMGKREKSDNYSHFGLRARLLSVLICLGTVGCSGGGDPPRTVWEMGVPEFNRIGAELIDCSVPNLGVENAPPPVRDVDVTGDGDPDVIVSFACVTGNSSSFSHVVAFDGRSPADAPRTVAILLHMPESKDYRQAVKEGARVRKITGHGDSLTLVADKWRPGDATACPSLTFVQIFTVDRKGLSAKEPTELDVNACTG